MFTTQSAAAPDITTLTKNPSIHYGTSPYTPITNAGPTNLTKDWWNPEIKTLYDPCPYGYRIPKSGTYTGFTAPTSTSSGTLSYGQTWKSSFFPASGYRDPGSGKFLVVGSCGVYWMSTPISVATGCSIYFYSSFANPNHSGGSSGGLPVRCIIDSEDIKGLSGRKP